MKRLPLKDYKRLLKEAGLIDEASQTSLAVYPPQGTMALNLASEYLRLIFGEHGYKEIRFPFLLSATDFGRINSEIYDFSMGLMRTTTGLILRPSGEAIIYPMFKKWIRTIHDLPLKVFSIGAMFRQGPTWSIFRQMENDYFIEAHAAHADPDQAEKQVLEDAVLIEKWLDFLALPYLKVIRPRVTNKPVANKHFGYDTVLPKGEASLAVAAYNQGQIFSFPFNVFFSHTNGQRDYTYQTEFGFSARSILMSWWLHSDEDGLILNPRLAPTQVKVFLQCNKEGNYNVDLAERVGSILTGLKVRWEMVKVDKGLGKLLEREKKVGTPICLKIGQLDTDKDYLKALIRGRPEQIVNMEALSAFVQLELRAVHQRLSVRAWEFLRASLKEGFSPEEVFCILENGQIVRISACQNDNCVMAIEKAVGKGEIIGFDYKEERFGKCLNCQKEGYLAYFARRI